MEEIIEPFEEIPSRQMPVPVVDAMAEVDARPVSGLEEAIQKIPGELRKEMEELLRADFSEVVRWKP